MTVDEALCRSQLFSGVNRADVQRVAGISKRMTVKIGQPVFREGDPARFLYIVARGRVALEMKLDRPDGSATPPTTVASVGPGDAFGWSAIVEPHVLTLSASAVQRSELVLVDGQALVKLLGRNRRMGYAVMANIARLLAQRLAETREAFVYERTALWKELAASARLTRRKASPRV